MTNDPETTTPVALLRAIKIDPDARSVGPVEVDPDAFAGTPLSQPTETIDFEPGHCLVIAQGVPGADHATRFRFANGPVDRPFFGPVLILGMASGNPTAATMNPQQLRARIIWEVWDKRQRRYAEPG